MATGANRAHTIAQPCMSIHSLAALNTLTCSRRWTPRLATHTKTLGTKSLARETRRLEFNCNSFLLVGARKRRAHGLTRLPALLLLLPLCGAEIDGCTRVCGRVAARAVRQPPPPLHTAPLGDRQRSQWACRTAGPRARRNFVRRSESLARRGAAAPFISTLY